MILLQSLSKQQLLLLCLHKKPVIVLPKKSVMTTPSKSDMVPSSGWKSNPKFFKWALIGVILAGGSYWLVRKHRYIILILIFY